MISVNAGVPLFVGIVFCILFVARQLNATTPFLDVKILGNRQYAISVISSMLLYFTMMGSSVLMPLYVQTVMGYSAVVSGLVTLPGSLATALVSPFAEIEAIRKKYLPKEEDKMEQLRRLDQSVSRKGTIAALICGIVSALVFGIGMCCTMVCE